MKKLGDKRGQFYLLAAVVVIGLFVGLIAVVNYSLSNSGSRVYDLSEELEVESANILDLGATSGNYPWQSFTQNFSSYAGNSIEIIYIVGNSTSIEAYKYNDSTKESIAFTDDGNYLGVEVVGTNYSFKKTPGEIFHFVMYEAKGGEIHVAKN